MKKIFSLIVMIGMFIGANAQMCKTTGGVDPTINGCRNCTGCSYVEVSLENTNSYKVTVYVDATIVDDEGNEDRRQKTVVISANKTKTITFRTKNVKGETKCADVPECSVSLRVETCND